jgi:hypothetical protein
MFEIKKFVLRIVIFGIDTKFCALLFPYYESNFKDYRYGIILKRYGRSFFFILRDPFLFY